MIVVLALQPIAIHWQILSALAFPADSQRATGEAITIVPRQTELSVEPALAPAAAELENFAKKGKKKHHKKKGKAHRTLLDVEEDSLSIARRQLEALNEPSLLGEAEEVDINLAKKGKKGKKRHGKKKGKAHRTLLDVEEEATGVVRRQTEVANEPSLLSEAEDVEINLAKKGKKGKKRHGRKKGKAHRTVLDVEEEPANIVRRQTAEVAKEPSLLSEAEEVDINLAKKGKKKHHKKKGKAHRIVLDEVAFEA
jgi:c-di-GMP-binding flagellar brake protein YcgR